MTEMKGENLKPPITLIYPGIAIFGFGQLKKQGEKFVGKNGELNWIHHGLASMGSSLKSKGYDVKLIDMRTLDSWEHFKKIIENINSEIIGISISNVDYKVAMKAVEIIKGAKPSTKIIVGGLNPTIFPEIYQNNEKIDYIVTGEGEITLLKIIQGIENNISVPKFNKGEKPDLNKLPWVDRTLFDYSRELKCSYAPGQEPPTVTMIAGRGCPYQCTYCQPAESLTYGRPQRMRSPQNVISELRTLKNKYDFKSINFWDDTFTLNKEWIFEFCDLYEKEKLDATIAACSRADIICRNEDMIKRLSEIGLKWLTIGFESGSQRILNLIKKGTTVEQNYKAASICKKYGIKIIATFMLGLPTETKSEQWATAKMIIETQPEYPLLFYFLPIVGTEIYDLCKEKNIILSSMNEDPFNIDRTGVYDKPRIKNINYRFLDMLRARIYLPYLIKSAIKNPIKIISYLQEKSNAIEKSEKEVD
jgi:anaerobic magnesium-protoporphyrin IX monomethyl ester cyclase